ncbi:MAG: cupin domain-containing protein [Candidatus Korarchaeota archaeon]|nr:cupin domain-containing protein [Candidatus Korarchaeota archaeon]
MNLEVKHIDETVWNNAVEKALTLFFDKEQKHVQMGILEVPPNTRLPKEGYSLHENSHEFCYVLSGKCLVGTKQGEKTLKAGDIMYNKPGTPHYTYNKSKEKARMFWIVSPPLNH